MEVTIHDREALKAVSPGALAAYARSAGWQQGETYRIHSNVYTGHDRPEIIVPRTDHLGDYATVVSQLIEVFARVAAQDQLTIYRSLVTGDRDMVRIRVAEGSDGSLGLNEGINLVSGARALILWAACSLHRPRPVYRAGAHQEARNLLEQVRLGQTEQGSFIITMLTPVVPPPLQPPLQPSLFPGRGDPDLDQNTPIQRKMTRRLVEALKAARQSTEKRMAGDSDAFADVVEKGVSANLCQALVSLIGPFPSVDIGVSWAKTRPIPLPEAVVPFGKMDAPILKEAAQLFQEREPKQDVVLRGFVQSLKRAETESEGKIHFRTHISDNEKPHTVQVELAKSDYEKAVQAHCKQAQLMLKGDLEYRGKRWQLLNAQIDEDDGEHPSP